MQWRPGADVDQPLDERNGKTTADAPRRAGAGRRLAGCGTSRMTTGSISRQPARRCDTMSAGELHGAADALGKSYAKNPNDKAHRDELCDGAADERRRPTSRSPSCASSRSPIRRTATCSPPTARRWPAPASSSRRSMPCAARRRPNIRTGSWCRRKRAILDQLGQTGEARKLYRRALDLKPNEPSVLSNLGMSYRARRRPQDGRNLYALGRRAAGRRQPRAPEPGAGGRPAGPLRGGREDRRPGAVARAGAGQRRLSALACWPSRTPGTSSRTKTEKPTTELSRCSAASKRARFA